MVAMSETSTMVGVHICFRARPRSCVVAPVWIAICPTFFCCLPSFTREGLAYDDKGARERSADAIEDEGARPKGAVACCRFFGHAVKLA